MPASTLSPDLNCNTSHAGGLEDQRALQLALELTMLGLNTPENEIDSNEYNDMNDDITKKRSQNMTECVPVPSSEHVAEIVGRQGCKIKALRAKTNTYIKTPVRGEEPVFVVTGRKEDVGDAKREILSAADHFSQIRASRRNNNHGTVNGMCPPSPNSPGQVTLQVRVPYRVVGLVVGPKGATIKRIQQLTHTYIVTPSRDKEPVFEVTGSAEHVEKARLEIEKHIAMRTGGMLMENSVTPDDIENNGFDVDQLGNDQRNNGMNYNSVFNAMNNMNGNLLRQNLIMPEYNLNAGKREAFELNGGYPSDLMYDPYSLLGQYRREEELTSHWSGMSSGSVWADTGRMQIPYGGKMVTPGRRGSLDTSPHLSPGSDGSHGSHGSQTALPSHATIRRISSDPVTSTDASNAWNAFPPIEFTSAFPTQSADSPPIQDN